MAKGKSSKSSGKVSAGIHSNVSKKLTNAARSEYLASAQRVLNQLDAHQKGKRVMVTMANPNKTETNKRFIRVPANTVWRDPKLPIYTV
jgi:succinylglutamate desuccinylase